MATEGFLVHTSLSKQHIPLSVSAYFVRVMPSSTAFFPMLSVWKEKVAFEMNRAWFKPRKRKTLDMINARPFLIFLQVKNDVSRKFVLFSIVLALQMRLFACKVMYKLRFT